MLTAWSLRSGASALADEKAPALAAPPTNRSPAEPEAKRDTDRLRRYGITLAQLGTKGSPADTSDIVEAETLFDVSVRQVGSAPRLRLRDLVTPVDETEATDAEALLEAARTAYQGHLQRGRIDPALGNDPEYLYRWSRRWLEAERALGRTKEKRVAAYTAHLERMRTLEARQKELVKQHLAARHALAEAKFFRIEAGQWLAQEKGR
jgi:hypothetical protein